MAGRGTVVRVLCAVAVVGCVDTTGPPFPLIETTDFAPSLGIDLSEMTKIGGGAYILDLEPGEGAVVGPGQRVHLSYTLHLADGTFLETREGLRFVTGCHAIVAGLEAGVRGMREGGLRRIIAPGRLGFGRHPPRGLAVPFGAILVFDAEVHGAVHLEDPRC